MKEKDNVIRHDFANPDLQKTITEIASKVAEEDALKEVIEAEKSQEQGEATEKTPKDYVDFSKFPKIRNREEKRAFEKVLRKGGKRTDKEVKDIIAMAKALTIAFDNERLPRSRFLKEGDQVKFNIDKMRGYPDWKKRQEAYREYIESNVDKVFTVRYNDEYRERPTIVELVNPDTNDVDNSWLFSDQDVLVLDNGEFKELYLLHKKCPACDDAVMNIGDEKCRKCGHKYTEEELNN